MATHVQIPADPDLTTQIHALRQGALELDEQHAALRARTRRALLAAVIDATLRREQAARMLTDLGMVGLPMLWQVTATVPVAYRRLYPDLATAAAGVQPFVHDSLSRIVGVGVAIGHPHDVQITPEYEDENESDYEVTATVTLTVAVKATDYDTALRTAARQLDAELAAADNTTIRAMPGRASWRISAPAPAPIDLDVDAPTWPGTRHASPPDSVPGTPRQLVKARRRQADAHTGLQHLQQAIRSRVIAELGKGPDRVDDLAVWADGFLAEVGLEPLPRAWMLCIAAATVLTVPAEGIDQAREAVRAAFHDRRRHERISVDDHFLDTHGQWPAAGQWQGTWGETVRVWVRTADEHSAADAATRLVRNHLDALALPQLHGHRLHITGTVQTIDPVLDPARD
ncbi:hypothetical protein AB0B66_40465 [Catellatospora sp. NPDC049111]|uniref:hypothetical protein n=1 Tax=Catellatospora sp. NPDC049111 TaxID=3155271 RepID=UPI00340A6EE6